MTNNSKESVKLPKLSRRTAVLIAGGLVLCFLALLGLRKWTAPVAAKNEFHKVRRGDMLISVVEGGALKAVRESSIRSEFEGISRIISIVPEGSYVKAGQILVELDSSELNSWGPQILGVNICPSSDAV